MNRQDQVSRDTTDESPTPWLALGSVLGVLLSVVTLQRSVPALVAAFATAEPKGFWYLSRVLGFVSFELLALSMLAGLALSTKSLRGWPGPAYLVALHRHGSLLGLAGAMLHATALLGDRYVAFDWVGILVPFASPVKTFSVGLGQVAMMTIGVLVASFYLRARIGSRAWRALHYTAFASFALALAHGLSSGTDRGIFAFALYALPGSLVFFGVVVRILLGGPPELGRPH